jgi:hypothetical protein
VVHGARPLAIKAKYVYLSHVVTAGRGLGSIPGIRVSTEVAILFIFLSGCISESGVSTTVQHCCSHIYMTLGPGYYPMFVIFQIPSHSYRSAYGYFY